MKNRLLLILVLLVSGTAAGYFLAWNKYSNSPADGYRKLVITNSLASSDDPGSEASTDESTTVADVLTLAPGFQQYLGSYLYANGLAEKEIRPAIMATLQIKPGYMAYEFTKSLIARYVELNPEAALDFMHSQLTPGSRDYTNLLSVLYREIALQDAELAWRTVNRIPSAQDQQTVRTLLLTRGIIESPEMLAELKSELTIPERQRLNYLEMAQQSPREAFRSALELDNQRDRWRGISMAIRRWAQQDPEDAFNAIDTLTEENVKTSLYQMVFQSWAATDVEAALVAAESLDDPRRLYLGIVLGFQAKTDPMAALQIAERYETQDQNNRLLQQIVRGWAAADPAAAAAYVESLDEFRRGNLIHAVAMAYLNQSPEAAFDWAVRMGASNSAVWNMIGRQYVNQFPDAARQKIDSLPIGPIRDSLISMYVGVKAQTNPLDMLSWIEQFEEEVIYQNVHGQVINGWLNRDPEAAADYVQSLQDGPFKQQQILGLIGRWAHTDTERAVKVLQELGPGRMQDQGLNILAMSTAGRNWEGAMDFVDDISDENVQKDARMNVIMQVSQMDRDRAVQLLSDYALEDDPRSAVVTNATQFGLGLTPRFMSGPGGMLRSIRFADDSVKIIEASEAIRIESSNE